MKFSFHYKTDDFSYIGCDDIETMEEAVEEYKRLTRIAKGEDVPGLARNNFNEILDIYITTGKIDNGDDCYGDMNRDQKLVIAEVRKSIARRRED